MMKLRSFAYGMARASSKFNRSPQKKSQPNITVQSMDELVRLAGQSGTLILETVKGDEHQYAIILETGMFSFFVKEKEENELPSE